MKKSFKKTFKEAGHSASEFSGQKVPKCGALKAKSPFHKLLVVIWVIFSVLFYICKLLFWLLFRRTTFTSSLLLWLFYYPAYKLNLSFLPLLFLLSFMFHYFLFDSLVNLYSVLARDREEMQLWAVSQPLPSINKLCGPEPWASRLLCDGWVPERFRSSAYSTGRTPDRRPAMHAWMNGWMDRVTGETWSGGMEMWGGWEEVEQE